MSSPSFLLSLTCYLISIFFFFHTCTLLLVAWYQPLKPLFGPYNSLFQSLSTASATCNDSELQPFLGCHRGAFNKVLHCFCSFLHTLPCCHHFPLFPSIILPFSEGKVYRCLKKLEVVRAFSAS